MEKCTGLVTMFAYDILWSVLGQAIYTNSKIEYLATVCAHTLAGMRSVRNKTYVGYLVVQTWLFYFKNDSVLPCEDYTRQQVIHKKLWYFPVTSHSVLSVFHCIMYLFFFLQTIHLFSGIIPCPHTLHDCRWGAGFDQGRCCQGQGHGKGHRWGLEICAWWHPQELPQPMSSHETCKSTLYLQHCVLDSEHRISPLQTEYRYLKQKPLCTCNKACWIRNTESHLCRQNTDT